MERVLTGCGFGEAVAESTPHPQPSLGSYGAASSPLPERGGEGWTPTLRVGSGGEWRLGWDGSHAISSSRLLRTEDLSCAPVTRRSHAASTGLGYLFCRGVA